MAMIARPEVNKTLIAYPKVNHLAMDAPMCWVNDGHDCLPKGQHFSRGCSNVIGTTYPKVRPLAMNVTG